MKHVVAKNYMTYLSMIEGSVDSRAYLHQWALVDGKRIDIANGGGVSCAFFVSFILSGFGYINGVHATVVGLEKKLLASGWKKVRTPRKGAVVVWESALHPTGPHAHVGFWLDERTAVSNHPVIGVPKKHHLTFGEKKDGSPKRGIVAVYWKDGLEKT